MFFRVICKGNSLHSQKTLKQDIRRKCYTKQDHRVLRFLNWFLGYFELHFKWTRWLHLSIVNFDSLFKLKLVNDRDKDDRRLDRLFSSQQIQSLKYSSVITAQKGVVKVFFCGSKSEVRRKNEYAFWSCSCKTCPSFCIKMKRICSIEHYHPQNTCLWSWQNILFHAFHGQVLR